MNPTNRRRAVPGLGLVLGLLATVAGCSPPDPPLSTQPDPDPRSEIELDAGRDGDGLDPRRWVAYHNRYGHGNNELACLTPQDAVVAGGTLRLTARAEATRCPDGVEQPYRSGFVSSRELGRWYPLYGRFEIRARVPHGQGLWPAFWLRHRTGAGTAEVDVLEVFHSQRPGSVSHAVHLPRTRGVNAFRRTVDLEPLPPAGSPGVWHDFAVDIRPAGATGVRFVFSLNGTVTGTFTDPDATWITAAPDEASWDLAVNLAVGGNWVGDPAREPGWLPLVGRCARTGEPPTAGPGSCPADGVRLATFPATFEIDRIRVLAYRS